MMPELKVGAVYGGTPVEKDKEMLKKECPQVLIGTPGRVLALMEKTKLGEPAPPLDKLTHFILDECDNQIDTLDMRRDVQKIFIRTPKKKQVMMFSATIGEETRSICKKFMQTPHEITVESEAKLTLHGLLQYTAKLEEKQKNKKLIDMLDTLEFNQVVIFVKSVKRALALDGLLQESRFPSMTLHELPKGFEWKVKEGDVVKATTTRIERLQMFKDFRKRILWSLIFLAEAWMWNV
jgi:superfamily II DNA/RNA helicase